MYNVLHMLHGCVRLVAFEGLFVILVHAAHPAGCAGLGLRSHAGTSNPEDFLDHPVHLCLVQPVALGAVHDIGELLLELVHFVGSKQRGWIRAGANGLLG